MDKKILTPKKKLTVLVICAAVLILFLYISAYLTPSAEPSANSGLEEKLEKTLSEMSGVGEVSVVINFSSQTEQMPQQPSEAVFFAEDAQEESLSEKVCGVLIVAEGAEDIRVRTEMVRAVAALLDVNMDQIEILY